MIIPAAVVALLSAPFVAILLTRPVLRRLALRNAARRPREALLVVLGSLLGAAIITASAVLGDSISASVRQVGRQHYGPMDELVLTRDRGLWMEASSRLVTLDRRVVDGVLPIATIAASAVSADGKRAAPRSQVVGLDFRYGSRFGGDPGATGMPSTTPGPGHADVTVDLARELGLRPGGTVVVFAYGAQTRLVVDRILARRGLAGFWLGPEAEARNVLVSPATFEELAGWSLTAFGRIAAPPAWGVAVSNRGGVESGAELTDPARREIARQLRGLDAQVVPVKRLALDQADAVGKGFEDMFTAMGSFGVLAGLLLLVNLFVMLAAERKTELGMIRAVGMRRSAIVGAFATEGWLYSLAATLLGTAAGIGLGLVLVGVSQRAFSSEHNPVDLVYVVEPQSLARAFAIGFAVTLVTIVLTSLRIARLNVIRAIRDLPEPSVRRLRRRWVWLGAAAAVVGALATVQALPKQEPFGLLLGPMLVVVGLGPFLSRRIAPAPLASTISSLVLAWGIAFFALFRDASEGASVMLFVVNGIALTAAAVVLATVQQQRVAQALSRVGRTPSLSLRLGLAYPLARRSRTGLTVAMYALVVFILTFITTLSAMIDHQVANATRNVSGGFAVVVSSSDANPLQPSRLARVAGVRAVAPLASTRAEFTVPGSVEPQPWRLTAFDRRFVDNGPPRLEDRGRYPSDRAAWEAVLADPGLIVVDPAFLQAGGGPAQVLVEPGDRVTIIDSFSNTSRMVTVAALAPVDYFVNNGALYGAKGARTLFGDRLVPSRAFVALDRGVDPDSFAASLQARFLRNGVEASSIRSLMDEAFTMTREIFQLFQGYLALGLIVGIAGLAVVMVRAVRERRRQIGTLRALGFGWRPIGRSFSIEAGFVAVEGTLIGLVLALVVLFDIVRLSDAFGELTFVVPYTQLAVLLALTVLASLLATLAPAVSATRIRPAVALRITD
jgi:putative ABC transport system permease protein